MIETNLDKILFVCTEISSLSYAAKYSIQKLNFFLFVLYLTAGLMSKLNEYSTETSNPVSELPNEYPNNIGQPTLWVNPFITRFKAPTTTIRVFTTVTTTRRTLKPLAKSILLDKITGKIKDYNELDYY
ncbi:hypothetical protein BpHYR1_037147 [Brachionus plicatilis]|uniref:Uncharacterized protein n=1 Tax=Brachionus plicatilis TaxID=10195 RepID=A0A3M7QC17_BRAPC|nr:hypothetical protein BpHYR1_037147 [Brachionus plicatilis]